MERIGATDSPFVLSQEDDALAGYSPIGARQFAQGWRDTAHAIASNYPEPVCPFIQGAARRAWVAGNEYAKTQARNGGYWL